VLVITIDDSGPGVPADLRERIFYPFFTTKERGSGVGLAMAQKIVASHGGSLALESEGGPGARFRMRLPLESDRAHSESGAVRKSPDKPSHARVGRSG
jgi:signal transduction histidine kinase